MYNETLWVFLNERNKRKGFSNMKTAGKGLFKMLLAFTIAISCLIGIGMTSVAVEYDSFVLDKEYAVGDTITLTSDVAIKTASTTTTYFRAGDKLKIGTAGNCYCINSEVFGEVEIGTTYVSSNTIGIVPIKGDGSDDNPFFFISALPEDYRIQFLMNKAKFLIDDLPAPEYITSDDAESIQKIRESCQEYAPDASDEELVEMGFVTEAQMEKLQGCEAALETALADKKAADAVSALIDALPDPEDITEDDIEDIEAAREAFEALSDKQQYLVGYENEYKLIDCEKRVDVVKAEAVMDLIDAIGEVELTDACIAKINAAIDAYDALTDKQQSYVENADDMYAAEEKYYSMLRESVQKKVLDKINALPAADKLTIANYYDVYDAAYEFNEVLTEKEQAGFDTTAKKKLDEAVKAMYSLALEAGEQLLSDYGADLEEETYNELKKVVDAAAAMVEAGKMPSYDEFIDLLWTVFYASFELYDIYKVIEGADAVWTAGSTDSIVIRIRQAGINNKIFDDTFIMFSRAGSKIYIDGELTDSKFITAEEGSVIITIMPEFLKTLSTGEHTISVLFDNDVTVTSKFTIKPAASVPASGESVSHYVILGISAVLLAGAVLTLRKHMVDSVK